MLKGYKLQMKNICEILLLTIHHEIQYMQKDVRNVLRNVFAMLSGTI